MKKPILALALFAALAGFADGAPAPSSPDAPLVTTLFDDGTTNTWSQADLVAALQLMNRKYHRDVASPSGRTAWHGRLVKQIIDTNALVKIERYADGAEFSFPFAPPPPVQPKTTVNAQGIPPALAAARARRAAERATTNTVTIVVTPTNN